MLSFRLFVFRLFSVITLGLLYGCASSPAKPQQTEAAPAKPVSPGQQSKPKEVKTSIDPDVLFMLLTAELAGQRGQYGIALEGYMEAAKRVHDPRFAERAAMIAMYLKDSGKLNEAVTIWLRQDANNITARKFAALAAVKSGDKVAATAHIESLLKNDPAGFDKSVLELASVLQKENKSDLIFDVLSNVAAKHPDQAVVYFVQALLATQMEKPDVAEAKVGQALRVQPGWDKALMLQAQLAMFSGDFNKAKTALKNASLKFPDDNKIKKLLAQVLVKAKDYAAAGQVYQDMLKSNPNDNESRLALGLVYLQQDKPEEAEDLFTKLLDVPEWRSQANFYLAKIAEQQDDTDRALRLYDKVSDEPVVFEAGIAAVALLGKEKQFAQADTRLASLAKKYPKQRVRILLVYSELLNQQQQYEKAFNLLTKALVDLPDDKNLLYARALMSEHLGKLDVLEADLKKILDKHPDNAEALNALGYTLADKTKRYPEAETYLLRALKLAPNEAVILDSYGWLQFKLGNTTKALDYLERAYAKQQENEIAAHLAEVLWAVNQKDKSKKIFNKAFREAPEDHYLLDFKARILDKAE
ncbi:MAG: tetratricopeptide repeat protein [Methylovulum sp.]|uniref:tetratricopeptide repeat protein n=1 Tax=Methylovulum sp. TaxID=1916980 RepID=UPI0026395372|nr:tetratricopeptide repeat protein [Methylovulum sp.]MDD2724441.1 tetratricopeptide repeat protein [Methylovulum sp.]MDD5123680.1 tetratricopeptide repeat protein [Methylovulum sp.]